MQGPDRLMELCRGGRMHWTGEGWLAEPDEVVEALAREGFQECKREIARNPASHAQSGGVRLRRPDDSGRGRTRCHVRRCKPTRSPRAQRPPP